MPRLLPRPPPPSPARLNLGVAPLLEKNLEFLNDCLDDLMVEQVGVAEPDLVWSSLQQARGRPCGPPPPPAMPAVGAHKLALPAPLVCA